MFAYLDNSGGRNPESLGKRINIAETVLPADNSEVLGSDFPRPTNSYKVAGQPGPIFTADYLIDGYRPNLKSMSQLFHRIMSRRIARTDRNYLFGGQFVRTSSPTLKGGIELILGMSSRE